MFLLPQHHRSVAAGHAAKYVEMSTHSENLDELDVAPPHGRRHHRTPLAIDLNEQGMSSGMKHEQIGSTAEPVLARSPQPSESSGSLQWRQLRFHSRNLALVLCDPP
jgi:hypothetical protein